MYKLLFRTYGRGDDGVALVVVDFETKDLADSAYNQTSQKLYLTVYKLYE